MRIRFQNTLRKVSAVLVACLLMFNTVGIALAVPDGPKDNGTTIRAEYAPDEIILKFGPTLKESEKAAIKRQFGLKTLKNLTQSGVELVKAEHKESLLNIVAKLNKNPKVMRAEPNYKFYPTATVNDPQFNYLWGLQNNGQVINGITGTPNIDIKAPAAWDTTQGSPEIVVAVIDTGIDISHPDIAPNIWRNTLEVAGDGIDNDGNGLIDDINGWDFYHNDNSVFDAADGDEHGTHVAGTIAAVANNATGVVGVAPKVKIMPLKFLGPNGGYTSDAIAAIGYAQKMGAKIASNSWGGGSYSTYLQEAITNFAGVFVAAAGNDGQNTDVTPNYPSAYANPNIVAVSAVNNRGEIATWSNYGATTVDVGAPGVAIYSLKPANGYQFMSGTSMATPHVTGVAALILSVAPSLDSVQVGDLIKRTATPLTSLQGKTVSGGMANAYAALKELLHGGPYVVSADPANGTREVPVDKSLTVTFSQPVQPGSSFNRIAIAAGTTTVAASLNLTGDILTVTPDTALATDTSYLLTIPAGSVVNSAGSPLAADYYSGFRTIDTLPPVVTLTNPGDGQTGVPLDQTISIHFNESIKGGSNFNGITVGGKPINNNNEFQWGIDGDTLYIHALQNFTYNTSYPVYLPAGAVTDIIGHPLGTDYTFSFTTTPDLQAPVVSWTDPEPGAAQVTVNKKLNLDFNEEIQAGINFSQISVSSNGVNVPVNLSITGNTLSISPLAKLAYTTPYTVVIPAGAITDLAGNGLADEYSFGFTTGKFDVFELPFPVDDAAVDPDKPVVYLINNYEAKLYALDFTTGALSSLDTTYSPKSLKLGEGQFSGELYVLLGNSVPNPYAASALGSIAVVDRNNFTLKDTIPMSTDPYDLVAGRDGSLYVSPASGQWTNLDSYNRFTKLLQDQTGIRHQSYARLHPTLDRIYTIDTDLSPRDYHAYNVNNGMFTDPKYPGGYDSPYHGDYPLKPYFEIDPQGKYLFNSSGYIFTTALEKAQDMRYAGKIDQSFNGIAFEQDLANIYTTPVAGKSVNIYRGTDFGFVQSLELAEEGARLFRQGRKLITLLNPVSTSNRYVSGVQILDIPEPPPVIMQTDPVNKALNQPVNKVITISFNENVLPGTTYDNITLYATNNPGSTVAVSKVISDNVLKLVPSQDLAYDTQYTLTLPAGAITDTAGKELGRETLSFSTEPAPDLTSPTVAATDPMNGSVGQSIKTSININFSEDVLAGPAYGLISLADNLGGSVGISQSISGQTLTLTPINALAYNTCYTLTIPSGALQDGAGNILAESYFLSFTTETPPDTTPPGVVNTDPADGAQGVSLDKVITITFSENILAGSAYDAIAVSDGVNQVNFTKSIAGNTLTLSPLTGWSYGTTYSVTIPANSIRDNAGNQLSGYQFGFSTVVPPDTTPPTILSTSPRDGETNVPLNTVVKITFSEAIQLGSTASGITFKKGTKNVNYSVIVSGNTLTIQPASTLNARSSYTVSIPAGAVQDLKGNQSAGAYSLSFSTARK